MRLVSHCVPGVLVTLYDRAGGHIGESSKTLRLLISMVLLFIMSVLFITDVLCLRP